MLKTPLDYIMIPFKEKFLAKIQENDTIVIYRHVYADGDALGSQIGLDTWIKNNFPNKNVFMAGTNDTDFSRDIFCDMNFTSADNYLSIVLDTANSERIDSESYKDGNYVIKIDHHIVIESYGDLNYEDPNSSSCTQILTQLFLEYEKEGFVFTPEVAKLLLAGMLTDTVRFTTSNTSANTLYYASKLIEKGVNISALNNELFSRSYDRFKTMAKVVNEVERMDNVAYFVFSLEKLKELGLDDKQAKTYLNSMSGIEGIDIWAAFVQMDDLSYRASVRSKIIPIDEVCQSYGGGGHRNACGVKPLTEEQIYELLKDLKNIEK